MATADNTSCYKLHLPEICIPLSGKEGRRLFSESLSAGYANIFFPLSEQFLTQNHVNYCAVSTLTMSLNTLKVDPKRIWNAPYRWYDENLLDCFPLDRVKQDGVSLDQFVCLASCNELDVTLFRTNEPNLSVEDFRKTIKDICSGDDRLLICSYSRVALSQPSRGGGHFSPIGAYHPKEDLCLIMDVARYKFPPYWVTVSLLWESMECIVKRLQLPRGYLVMRKRDEKSLIVFQLSTTFQVAAAKPDLTDSSMLKFVQSWRSFLSEDNETSDDKSNLSDVIMKALLSLNEGLSFLLEKETIFTSHYNVYCVSNLYDEHTAGAKKILAVLENTELYKMVGRCIKDFILNNRGAPTDVNELERKTIPSSFNTCPHLNKIGKLYAANIIMDDDNDTDCVNKKISCISDSHYIAMLLLSWPYEMEISSSYTNSLANHVKETLPKYDEILVNEIKILREKLQSLLLKSI